PAGLRPLAPVWLVVNEPRVVLRAGHDPEPVPIMAAGDAPVVPPPELGDRGAIQVERCHRHADRGDDVVTGRGSQAHLHVDAHHGPSPPPATVARIGAHIDGAQASGRRPIRKNSGLGRNAVRGASRFDNANSAVIEPMSQISSSVSPACRATSMSWSVSVA